MKYQIIKKIDFPNKLKRIKNAPERIYAIGNIDILYESSFAVVGSRNVS